MMYRDVLRIRKVELKIEELYSQDEMKTPVHLSLGQEAVAVGICTQLTKDDYVFSNHRSHAHYLAKGGNLRAMVAELYCKETGCSKGRGGSMHLIDISVGLLGSSSIVGGSIPHAVGAALAATIRKQRRIAISFFGDGASEEGVLYESMNFATLKKLPVVFICENNYYSVCTPITLREADPNISMRPRAFDIPAVKVDGMDIQDVYIKGKKALEHVRAGKGPYFLECVVQRWRGHVGPGDPLCNEYRLPKELRKAHQRDPLKDLQEHLLKKKILTRAQIESIQRTLDKEINEAFLYAQQSPLPKKEDIEKHIYA